MTGLRKQKCKLFVLSVIAFLMIAIAVTTVISKIIDKVISGHGSEQFKTFEGFEFNYIGALAVITLMTLVLLIAPLLYWFDPMTREEQDFKKKYDVKDE